MFEVHEERYTFDSARDAIDAASAFEASTISHWEYEVRCLYDENWYVRVNCIDGPDRFVRGYLAPQGDAA